MLTTEQINDLHRLYWSEHWPIRKIERQLNIGWRTIRKYLDAPAQAPLHRDRPSKLDPFKGAVAEWLEKDPGVSSAVIEQKLRAAGYQGGYSILREYVRNARPHIAPKRAFVRMEPLAGERFEVDWGHFGALMDMLNHLLASQVDHSLVRKLKTYTEPTLLIVDELG